MWMTVIIAITYVDALYKVVDLVGDSVDDDLIKKITTQRTENFSSKSSMTSTMVTLYNKTCNFGVQEALTGTYSVHYVSYAISLKMSCLNGHLQCTLRILRYIFKDDMFKWPLTVYTTYLTLYL